MPLFRDWLLSEQLEHTPPNVSVLRERDGAREQVLDAILETVRDHFVGLDVLRRMGFAQAATVIANRLPTRKRIRSGDLGEILATEYVDEMTPFQVPVRRLRYKDDRDMAMRGDDAIGLRRVDGRVRVLKVEAKSRARLTAAVVEEASMALMTHSSRPNPSTLAFLSTVLRMEGRDAEAEMIDELQTREIRDSDIEHLIFTLSGNNPRDPLTANSRATVTRHLVGVVIQDHQDFVHTIFEAVYAEVR